MGILKLQKDFKVVSGVENDPNHILDRIHVHSFLDFTWHGADTDT